MSEIYAGNTKEFFPELDYPEATQANATEANVDCRLLLEGIPLGRLDDRQCQNLENFSSPADLFFATNNTTYQQQATNFQHVVSNEEGLITAMEFLCDNTTIPLHESPSIWRTNEDSKALQCQAHGGKIDAWNHCGVPGASQLNATVDELNSFHHGHFAVHNVLNNQASIVQGNADELSRNYHLRDLPLGIPIHDYCFELPVDQLLSSPNNFNVKLEDDKRIAKQVLHEVERPSTAAIPQAINFALPPHSSSRHTQLEELGRDLERLSDEIQQATLALSPPIALSFLPLSQSPVDAGTNHPYLEDHFLLAPNELTTLLASGQTYNMQNNCYNNAELQPDCNYALVPPRQFLQSSLMDISSPIRFAHSSFIPRGLRSPPMTDYSEHISIFSALSYHPLSKNSSSPSMKLESRPSSSDAPLTPPQNTSKVLPSWTMESRKRVSPSTRNFLRSTITEFDYSDSPLIKKKARGRRPLASSHIGLSQKETNFWSNPDAKSVPGGKVFDPVKDFNLNPELLKFCEATKTGKLKKLFICQVEECGKCFRRSEHLKRHARTIHTDEKPYKCPWGNCQKRFNREDNLNQHLKIHSR